MSNKTKYVLIRRTDDYSPVAMSLSTARDLDNTPFYGTTVGGPEQVTLAYIRKERIRIYTDEEHMLYKQDCAEYEEWNRFRDKYHGRIFQATVTWFDKPSGMGCVRIDENLSLPIYSCNIKGRKTWFPETACVYYEPGETVDIRIDCHSRKTLFAIGETPGHFDAVGWDRIKGQNLAFRCDEDGKALNGLFE